MAKKTYNDEFSKLPINEKAKVLAEYSTTPYEEWFAMLSMEEKEYVNPDLTVYGSDLNYVYDFLETLKKSNPVMFDRAVFCSLTKTDPSKLYTDGLLALEGTFTDYVEQAKVTAKKEKRDFSLIDKDMISYFKELRQDKDRLNEIKDRGFTDPRQEKNQEIEKELEHDEDDYPFEIS